MDLILIVNFLKKIIYCLNKLHIFILYDTTIYVLKYCGYSSVVERHLAKVHVARSTRVTRYLLLVSLERWQSG